MLLEEVEIKILMMKNAKNKLRNELTEISSHGPKLVTNLSINHFNFRFLIATQDFMEQPLGQMSCSSPQKHA